MQQAAAAADWSTYYDPNQQHGMYNNTYYKTDYNCLNQQQQPPTTHLQTTHQTPAADPSMYNGSNYYYYPQVPDPYINHQQQQMSSPQPEYSPTNLNHQPHSNYPM